MATAQGWICPYCDYTQNDAPDFMAAEPAPPLEVSTADRLCGEAVRADPSFPNNLLNAFHTATSARYRGIILSLVAHAQLHQAIPLFQEQLQSPDPWLRYWAARGLELLNVAPSFR